MERAVRSFPVLWGGVVVALLLVSASAVGSPPVALVDPQWQPLNDSQGLSWMIDQQSNLRVNGGVSMLMSVGAPTVNGVQFQPNRTQMRPDGSEYVFEGGLNGPNIVNPYGTMPGGLNMPPVPTVRRIKIDLQSSTVRFVDTFQNTGAAPVQVTVATGSSLRTFIQSVVCGPSGTALNAATGQPMTNQPAVVAGSYHPRVHTALIHLALPEHDGGVAFQTNLNSGRGLPGVVLFVPESATVKPSIDIHSMRTIQVSFALTIPAQSSVSVAWGLAQRSLPANLDAQEMKNQLKVFQDREWLADLPENVARSIANYRRFNSVGNLPIGPLLQPVLDLAAQYHLERGKADVLVQDEQAQLPGSVEGGNLSIETPQGKAVVPVGEVALLWGGAGIERPMRVYLRNGEILAGRVGAKDLVLKAEGGVEARLPPEKVNLLFLHAAKDDGTAVPEARSIVETQDGQRLLLSGSDAQFHAVTPWGGFDVGIDEIDRLSVHREPQPVYRLALKDGSSLSVLLEGAVPQVKSLRFGPIKLSAAGLRQLWSLKTPLAAKESTSAEPTGVAGPLCRLVGENVLAGALEAQRISIATVGGTLEVPVSRIQDAQRGGDPQAGGPFEIQLNDGRRLTGVLAERTVSIRFHGKVWDVPAQHLVGISGGKPAAAGSTKVGMTEEEKAGLQGGGPLPAVTSPAPSTGLPLPLPPADVNPFGLPPQVPSLLPSAPAQPVVPAPADNNPFG